MLKHLKHTLKIILGHSMAIDTVKKSMFQIAFKFGMGIQHLALTTNICLTKINQIV